MAVQAGQRGVSASQSREAALAEVIAALRHATPATASPDNLAPDIAADSLTVASCAICRLAERSAAQSLRAFFAEFVNDPQVRARFRQSRGFCREHLPLLARCGDALGVAILYADLAAEARARWNGGALPAKQSKRRWFAPAEEAACPSCEAEAAAEQRYAAALAAGLGRDPTVWPALEAGASLCARHVETVAASADPAGAARLLKLEAARMDALCVELEEFVRKNDYRFRDEPWGPESDAWRRALARLRS